MAFKNLNALGQLLGCYLHQDWLDDYDNYSSALQAVVTSEPKEKIAAGVGEIDALLVRGLPEKDLKAILVEQIGCYFDPSSDGLTYKQWLIRVRSAFSQT
jgi:hypothetical protein